MELPSYRAGLELRACALEIVATVTELLWAAKRGDLTTVDAELAAGASLLDVDSHDGWHKGWNVLVYGASSRGCSAAAFAELTARTRAAGALEPRRAATALHEAARIGAIDKVRRLLAAGADPNVRTLRGSLVLDSVAYLKTPQHLECLEALLAANYIHGAVDSTRLEQLALFASQALSFGHRGALEALARYGGAGVMEPLADRFGVIGAELLLGRGLALPVKLTKEDATEALRTAVRLDDVESARTLVALGADLAARDSVGPTLLSDAAGADAVAVARWLLEGGADPNAQGKDDWPPLHHAVSQGAARTTRLLLAAGASLDYVDEDGDSCSVISFARDDAIDVLYEHGVDLDTTWAGSWLLRTAAQEGDRELALRLLDYGADANFHEESIGQSALHEAVSNEEAAVALLLLERGADPNVEDLDGDRPLDLARSRYLYDALVERGAEGGLWSSRPRPEIPAAEFEGDGALGQWFKDYQADPWNRWDGRGDPPVR